MIPFIHLHVHSQYSVLDGQASVKALVDKAINDGMRGIALTDHGNMFGIKEFFDYVNQKNGKFDDEIKALKKELKSDDLTDERRSEIECSIENAKKAKFIPIFGCEMYVADGDMTTHVTKHDSGRHLVVLAKNEQGYHNLIKLVSMAWTDGYYKHPRIDKQHLEMYHDGLIVCSACLGGEVPRLLQDDRVEDARRVIQWYKKVWGDDYYLELQRHKATKPRANHEVYPLQVKVNNYLMQLSKEEGVKLVCTNDVHFVNEEDSEAHDRLICVSTGKFLDDENRMLYSKQEWMKTTAEMNELFADVPEALSNTVEILEKVSTYSIEHGPILPNFDIPEDFATEETYRATFTDKDLFDEFTRDENGNVVLSEEDAKKKINSLGGVDKLYRLKLEADYLKKLTMEGAHKRYGENIDNETAERLKFELHIMKTMGFPGYFLIVQDFIRVARERLGVSVGPGRGSAAGSAVAYCLGITQIDPIKYDLLFERFLNPDRISLPDIDVDFDDDGRAEVLKYVTEKYGAEKVAHIITYGTMAAKSAIKDVARVQRLPLPESDRLAKLIPSKPNEMPEENGKTVKISIKNCVKHFPDFAKEYNSPDAEISSTLHFAETLEGNVRNTGVHACGVIICRDPITDWVPVSTADDKSGERLLVTQYEGSVIESTGLIKMDFLGLKTLSIIKDALKNIKHTRKIDIDIDNVDINDKNTYQLYCQGATIGTFQFESPGMQKYLKELQPSTFEDLIAMNALYRPGPMSYIPQFIARKHGQEPISYDIPVMEKYLKDTYGITVYQEQVMLLSRLLANFTRGESDVLRKAMGKKQLDKLAHMKPKFIENGQKNGYDAQILEKIWGDWESFASYAFNKSHATCYSWVAFQTAYLKANYPSEYMAAVLSRNLADLSKLSKFMDECKRMKIEVKGPDINESFSNFSVNSKGDIRFGLAAIKGIGMNAVQAIIDERENNGEFTSIYDFVERVNLSAVNRKAIEVLAMAGAFDSFTGINRENFFDVNTRNETFAEQIVRYGQKFQLDKNSQINSLFGGIEEVHTSKPEILHNLKWSNIERLEKEREYVGLFLSGHPLDPYYMELKYGCNTTLEELPLKTTILDTELTFGGLVIEFKEGVSSKNNNKYGRMKIEDTTGSYEIMLFGNDYINFRNYGVVGTPIFVRAKFSANKWNQSKVDLRIQQMDLLENVKGKLIHNILIDLPLNAINEFLPDIFANSLKNGTENRGDLFFRITDIKNKHNVKLKSEYQIPINRQLTEILNDMEIKFAINYL
ncbi:MAG: DNA polymerase III subunit alpha [Muribaculaceae bacterium]|nr:DNA polymerase III subunit alpha [Muribaculaceae bacterium]